MQQEQNDIELGMTDQLVILYRHRLHTDGNKSMASTNQRTVSPELIDHIFKIIMDPNTPQIIRKTAEIEVAMLLENISRGMYENSKRT